MSINKKILVVDDEVETLDLFRAILEMSGFEPVTVLNSVDAITIAEMERPACVLLDVMMPYLDGFTLCKMMRLHPATKTLPIIFVTAYSALDFEDRFKESGADLTLFKPVSMARLIDTIETVLQLRPPKKKQTAVLTPPPGTRERDTATLKTKPLLNKTASLSGSAVVPQAATLSPNGSTATATATTTAATAATAADCAY
ncbi:MAG: response regulator [Anaerolineae bacterium]